jgi:hypothetical protein
VTERTRWPYAVFSAATKAGWGRKGDDDLQGIELVLQTLELLTGFPAMYTPAYRLPQDWSNLLHQNFIHELIRHRPNLSIS